MEGLQAPTGAELFKERTFAAPSVSINFAEGPRSGPPLVLLHGGGGRWQEFLPMLPYLANGWHVCALDLRGHGRSGRVSRQYRPEHYSRDVTAFVGHHFSEPAILFGHSLGGWVAAMVARELRDGLRALILGDPPLSVERFLAVEGSEPRRSMWRAFHRMAQSDLPVPELAAALAGLPVSVDPPSRYGDLPGVDDDHLREWGETLSRVDASVVQYHAQGRLEDYVQNVDLEGAFRAITCPVLLIQADPSVGGRNPDCDVEQAMRLLSDGTHVRLQNVGHNLGLGTPDVTPLLRAVKSFLQAH